jgi:hypothetical protein
MNAQVAAPAEEEIVPATADETLADLLDPDRQRRAATPIRRSFLQEGRRGGQPGPMLDVVRDRRVLALDLLLLLHCGAGASPWDVTLPAMAWARALDLPQTTSSETTISKNWSWLEQKQLIRSDRHQRMRRVFLLKEDGSGQPYTRSKGEERGFFHLPFAYFTERWHQRLKLPAKAVLLIALSKESVFDLRTERASGWYGISADTLQRGLDELREAELLEVSIKLRKAPRARMGITQDYRYRLIGSFAR